MVRILGVNIPDKKAIYISLTEIFGIGVPKAKMICEKLKIDINKKTYTLTEEELLNLRNEIAKYKIEGDLRQEIARNILELKESTRKGKRKTVANKKEAKQQG